MKKRLALVVLPFLLFHSHSTLPLRSQFLTDSDYVIGGIHGHWLFKENIRSCGIETGVLKKITDPKDFAIYKRDPKLKKYKWVVQNKKYARFFKKKKEARKFVFEVCWNMGQFDKIDNLYKKGL